MIRSGKIKLEKDLEAAVFGNEDFYDKFDQSTDDENSDEETDLVAAEDEVTFAGLDDDQLFVVDDGGVPMETSDAEDQERSVTPEHETRKSVWYDSDDEKLAISLATVPRLRKLRRNSAEDIVTGLEYAKRLRAQFERIYPVPDWALPAQQKKSKRRRLSNDSDESDSDASLDTQAIALAADPLKALFQTSESLVRTGKSAIRPPTKLDIKRLRDANHQAPSFAAIQTMSFHPRYPLLMTGGYDRTLRIYHIDGKINTPASSLHLRNVPIQNAEFHPDGKRVFIGGRRKYFHIWNLDNGQVQKISRMYGHEGMQTSMERFSLSRDGALIALVGTSGWVNFLSAETGQWVDAVKAGRGVSDITWLLDNTLIIATAGAEVWEYSTAKKEVVRRWNDDGGTNITKLAVGANDRYLAIGSRSGIVNIFDRLHSKLLKSMPQITTSIHDLQFSGDGQILAITSRAKKDILKMVHLPSCTVYQNWPTQVTPLGKIGALAFSNGSEMFAVGNEAGRVTLWGI